MWIAKGNHLGTSGGVPRDYVLNITVAVKVPVTG